MLKWILLIWAPMAQASPTLFPEVQNFKDLAEFTIIQTPKEEARWLLGLNQELHRIGLEILKHYQTRHVACEAQLTSYLNELNLIERRPIAEIMSRYHDGVGLPEAPKHCIYGRVYSVHPLINTLRLKTAVTPESRKQMVEDLEELLRYIPQLQKNLEPETPEESKP